MKAGLKSAAIALALSALPIAASAHGVVKEVQFKKGADNAVYNGKVKGYDVDVYKFRANKCQNVKVELLKPESNVEAYLQTKDEDNLENSTECIPYAGEYKIKVMQTRNAARKNKSMSYQLKLTIK